jgi:cell division protein FtsN
MPKDYKNTPRSSAKPDKKRTAPVVPNWVWLGGILLVGVAIGLAAPRLLGLVQHHASHRAAPHAAASAPAKPAPTNTTASDKDAAPHFDFYKLLPKLQVVIPKEDKDVQTDTGKTPVARPGAYVLQVASFQHYSDADAMKAKLALLGIEAKIQQVKVDNGESWNRVRIGPISDLAKLNATRKTLAEHHIEPLLIRIK